MWKCVVQFIPKYDVIIPGKQSKSMLNPVSFRCWISVNYNCQVHCKSAKVINSTFMTHSNVTGEIYSELHSLLIWTIARCMKVCYCVALFPNSEHDSLEISSRSTVCVCVCVSCSVMLIFCSLTDWSLPWNSPGKNTGVCSYSLLQGNLPDPGVSCITGRFFYCLSRQVSP